MMGVYWKVANFTRKEVLDQTRLGYTDKWAGLFGEGFPETLVYMMWNEWLGDDVRFIPDSGETQDLFYDMDKEPWKDVTERAHQACKKALESIER